VAFSRFDPLFNPKAIAVFGASEREGSVAATVFGNLVEGGFPGTLVAVNPKHQQVRGKPCFKSILDVGMPIDLAVIATPAATVPTILRQCGEVGIHYAVILSAGFGETGKEGEVLEAKLLEAARDSGVRFIGPNCVGLVRPHDNMDASFLKSKTPKGRLALVSQSGAMCAAISDWAGPHNLGFSALVSVGNSLNIDFGDVLRFLSIDPMTDAILLYVEGVRNARSFVSGLRAAARLKPVIVLKSGRHNHGLKAAQTHSAARRPLTNERALRTPST
jgi:acetyltransferase